MVVFVCRTFTVPIRPATFVVRNEETNTDTETENSVDEGAETEGD